MWSSTHKFLTIVCPQTHDISNVVFLQSGFNYYYLTRIITSRSCHQRSYSVSVDNYKCPKQTFDFRKGVAQLKTGCFFLPETSKPPCLVKHIFAIPFWQTIATKKKLGTNFNIVSKVSQQSLKGLNWINSKGAPITSMLNNEAQQCWLHCGISQTKWNNAAKACACFSPGLRKWSVDCGKRQPANH